MELQYYINPIIEKADYIKLEFEKSDVGKDVTFGFSLQDSKSGRIEWDSVHELQRLLKKALEKTNWRDGVNYRSGFIYGRFRGVEGEENIKKLVEIRLRKESKK
ncbi:MAG: hypothetical protein Q8L11_00995 [Candidatus Moranbacteria bacterium]|nr:hypothetical protein [Candidatus Moranbacteria bacterium]